METPVLAGGPVGQAERARDLPWLAVGILIGCLLALVGVLAWDYDESVGDSLVIVGVGLAAGSIGMAPIYWLGRQHRQAPHGSGILSFLIGCAVAGVTLYNALEGKPVVSVATPVGWVHVESAEGRAPGATVVAPAEAVAQAEREGRPQDIATLIVAAHGRGPRSMSGSLDRLCDEVEGQVRREVEAAGGEAPKFERVDLEPSSGPPGYSVAGRDLVARVQGAGMQNRFLVVKRSDTGVRAVLVLKAPCEDFASYQDVFARVLASVSIQ